MQSMQNMFRLRVPLAALHRNASVTTMSPFRSPTAITESKFYVVGVRCFSVEPVNKAASVSEPLDLSSMTPATASPETSEVVAEATFRELGLAHSWPSGWVQAGLEVAHNASGMEWWAVIATATVCVRLLMFPIVIKAQKNVGKLQEHQPEMMRLQGKMADAADKEGARKVQMELHRYMEKHDVRPFAMYVPMLGSAFVFSSMFFALRNETEIH